MDKKGAMTGGTILIIAALLVGAYFVVPAFGNFVDGIFVPTPEEPTPTGGSGITPSNCPSSGLTEVTINAQEALASVATNANVSYYIYDDGVLIKNGDTGSDGAVSIDVECAAGRTYKGLILNEQAETGYYPQEITVDASGPTDTHNLKMYEYGQINVASVVSSASPSGNDTISTGLGKNCGFTITFTENESVAAFNKPIIMCLANVTSVTDITMDGVTEVNAKKPTRLSAISGYTYYAFELDELILSTSGAKKINAKIQLSSSKTPKTLDNLSCMVIDQATYKKAEYKTMGLTDGWIEAAENQETLEDIGAPDSNKGTLYFNPSASYC